MLAEVLKWVFGVLGVRGTSATVLLALLLVLAYGNKAVSAGQTASRGLSHLQVVAVVLTIGLLSGVLMLDTEKLRELLDLAASVDWFRLWREVTG